MNYQGVLRDAASRPLDGSFDMVFRLIDAAGGDEIQGCRVARHGHGVDPRADLAALKRARSALRS
jgi:hypothetical protein